MALIAPKGGDNKKFAPQANIVPGTYPGRLVQIIDYGLQPQKPYLGKDKPPAQEIGLTYELVDEFMKDEGGKDIEDKPRWVSETLPFYGLYADKAKSTLRYLAFDPNQDWGGDFSKALDVPINVNIVNNKSGDKVYDNVNSIAAMRPKDAANCPPLRNGAKTFDLDAPDLEIFKGFPQWIQDKIKGNLNYNGSKLQKLLGDDKPAAPKAAPKDEPKAAVEPPFDVDVADDNPY